MFTMTLKQLRDGVGLSQRDVARRLNLTQPAIAQIEKTGSTRPETMERYADVLGKPYEEVYAAARETRKEAEKILY